MEVMTRVQWDAYQKSLEGRKVQAWTGWVIAVKSKMFGGYKLTVDMDDSNQDTDKTDVSFEIPDDTALALSNGSSVTFSGAIDSAYNIFGNLQVALIDATVVAMASAETSTPTATPTPMPATPLPTNTNTPEPTATPQPTALPAFLARCLDVSVEKINSIETGLTVDTGVFLNHETAQAVKSNDFSKVFFIAAEVDGPEMEGNGQIGIWASNDLDDDKGLIFAVGGLAVNFSEWGDGSKTDAHLSLNNDGAEDAEECVRYKQVAK
jgi:hypothetical protein